MDYLKSEHLKFKRTISNKLIFIVPLITAIFAWLMGGFMGYQYMTLYWWYAFLLLGAIAILCSLSHRKEENAGKYYSVFSMPVNLSGFEFAKGIILIEKLLVSAIFLALLISISNIISPATAVYSVLHSIAGSIGIILASVWQIPLCLYLTRKTGMFVPIVLNTILGIVLSTATALGNTIAWWFVPYCWAPKLAEPLMGIEINGTYSGNCGLAVPNRHKNMLAKLTYLYGSGVFALFFLFLVFVIGIHLLGMADTVHPGMLTGAAAGIAFCNLIIYILHLFLSFRFGLGLSLFWGVFESLQCILYSNIELKGIARYIPFSWSMNWVQDILSQQIFNYGTEKIWIAALTTGGLLLTLLWFSHWEGRKNYE